ncbi:MAG: zinc-ribbon domain-containing protein [Candidatus Hermodarchaeota archaeon]
MAEYDYKKAFSCPRCGVVGNVYLVKVSGKTVIVKQRCPQHGGRQFKVNLNEKDKYIQYIKDSVFRCFRCGEKADQSYLKVSGPWTLIKTKCPTHGATTTQKIWSTVYNEISSEEPLETQPDQPESELPEESVMVSEENKFCPNCGAQLTESGNFCGECGSKLN